MTGRMIAIVRDLVRVELVMWESYGSDNRFRRRYSDILLRESNFGYIVRMFRGKA